jgi:hypothetical protein
VFDDEADTLSVDPGSDSLQAVLNAALAADTMPIDMIGFDDTAVRIALDERTTDQVIMLSRPGTDSEWPPPPKPPDGRRVRRAGVYNAITGVSKLIKIR